MEHTEVTGSLACNSQGATLINDFTMLGLLALHKVLTAVQIGFGKGNPI